MVSAAWIRAASANSLDNVSKFGRDFSFNQERNASKGRPHQWRHHFHQPSSSGMQLQSLTSRVLEKKSGNAAFKDKMSANLWHNPHTTWVVQQQHQLQSQSCFRQHSKLGSKPWCWHGHHCTSSFLPQWTSLAFLQKEPSLWKRKKTRIKTRFLEYLQLSFEGQNSWKFREKKVIKVKDLPATKVVEAILRGILGHLRATPSSKSSQWKGMNSWLGPHGVVFLNCALETQGHACRHHEWKHWKKKIHIQVAKRQPPKKAATLLLYQGWLQGSSMWATV